MSRPSVYLAGPITGLTFADGSTWRDAAAEHFADVGIDAFSPLRCKEYLTQFGVLSAKDQTGTENYTGVHPLSSDKGIMARDRNDVMRRDMMLVNFVGAERVSIGTCIEIGWADAHRRPVVLVMEDDNVHRHAMVEEAAGFRVHTMEEAYEIVQAILLPGRAVAYDVDQLDNVRRFTT